MHLISPTNSPTFPKIEECRAVNTKLNKFRKLTLLSICNSSPKTVIIPTIFVGKHVKWLEISLETMIRENQYVQIADFVPKM